VVLRRAAWAACRSKTKVKKEEGRKAMKRCMAVVAVLAVLWTGASVFAQEEGELGAAAFSSTAKTVNGRFIPFADGRTGFGLVDDGTGKKVEMGVSYRSKNTITEGMVLCTDINGDGNLEQVPWVLGPSIKQDDISKTLSIFRNQGPFWCKETNKAAVKYSDGERAYFSRIPGKAKKIPRIFIPK
jgi:hypothetical protein